MLFLRSSEDETPFARGPEGRWFGSSVAAWAENRSFPVEERRIVVAENGATALVPLHPVTPGMLVVEATAVQALDVSLRVEPRAWPSSLALGRLTRRIHTQAPDFDRHWLASGDDTPLARQLLDDERRLIFSDVGCWCRLSYKSGAIEVVVDDEQLAGSHVLGALEIALLFARGAPTSPRLPGVYR